MTTHPSTEQTALDFTEKESLGLRYNAPPDARTQRGRLLKLLLEARGREVPLPEILDLRISQYSARIAEPRKLGFVIQNRTETHGGQRRSWFRLILQPANGAAANVAPHQGKE